MAGGRKRRERGVALVTVMALIASIGVLVASAVAISQYSAAETDTLASLQRSALEAESARQPDAVPAAGRPREERRPQARGGNRRDRRAFSRRRDGAHRHGG